MTWNMPDDLPPSGGTFFHLSAYWRTLQQRRSRTYVSVIRRKWIRPKRKPTRALNCKKVGRARARADMQCRLFGEKRISLFSLRLSVVQLFLPLIFIHLSICRPSVHRSFLRRCATVSFLPPLFLFFSPVPTVFQFRSLRPVVVFVSRVCHSRTVTWALRWPDFRRSDRKWGILEETVRCRDYETICERREVLLIHRINH